MYTILLCIAFFAACCAVLYRRYSKLDALAKRNRSFLQAMESEIRWAMLLALCLAKIAVQLTPVIVTTEQPAILVPQAKDLNGANIFLNFNFDLIRWKYSGEEDVDAYLVSVRTSNGKSRPNFIVIDDTVHVIEDPTLTDTGTWTQTTSRPDTSSVFANWLLKEPSKTVIKTEVRLPTGAHEFHMN